MSIKLQSFKELSQFNWDDVEPFKQYDDNPPIFNLTYNPNYKEMMDYFRSIVQKEEISLRSYELTTFVVQNLCSNYNAWYVRQKCIEKLDLDIDQELKFVQNLMINNNEKVFQIWDHRKFIINKRNSADKEIEFLDLILSRDNKNYHAWSYRIWLCQKFNLFKQEWEYIQKYFDEDLRNNSIWNYRYFLFSNKIYEKQGDIEYEINFALKKIQILPDNESSWNYLQGFFKVYEFKCFRNDKLKNQQGQQQQLNNNNNIQENEQQNKNKLLCSQQFKDFPIIEKTCMEMIKDHPKLRFLIALLIQICLLSKSIEKIKLTIGYTDYLANDIDKIRNNYWNFFKQNILEDYAQQLYFDGNNSQDSEHSAEHSDKQIEQDNENDYQQELQKNNEEQKVNNQQSHIDTQQNEVLNLNSILGQQQFDSQINLISENNTNISEQEDENFKNNKNDLEQ